jgi:hypothetical protein
MIDANKETTEPRVTNGKGERFFCRNHDLVNCYGISVTNDHGYIPFLVFIQNLTPGL